MIGDLGLDGGRSRRDRVAARGRSTSVRGGLPWGGRRSHMPRGKPIAASPQPAAGLAGSNAAPGRPRMVVLRYRPMQVAVVGAVYPRLAHLPGLEFGLTVLALAAAQVFVTASIDAEITVWSVGRVAVGAGATGGLAFAIGGPGAAVTLVLLAVVVLLTGWIDLGIRRGWARARSANGWLAWPDRRDRPRCSPIGAIGRVLSPYRVAAAIVELLLARAIRRMPARFRDRYREEWRDHRLRHRGSMAQLWWATCVWATAGRTARELQRPDLPRHTTDT
jgi:hypothetical protein